MSRVAFIRDSEGSSLRQRNRSNHSLQRTSTTCNLRAVI